MQQLVLQAGFVVTDDPTQRRRISKIPFRIDESCLAEQAIAAFHGEHLVSRDISHHRREYNCGIETYRQSILYKCKSEV